MSNVDVFARIRQWAPRELVEFLDQLLLFFPEELKYRVKQVIDTLPSEGDNMHKVLELVRCQWEGIQSEQRVQIALVGPARAGKSSLFKMILRQQLEPSKPIFKIVDTQGLEEYLGFKARNGMLEEIDSADIILLILDGRYTLSDSTVRMYEFFCALNKTLLVVLNKMDLVEHPAEVVKAATKQLQTSVFLASIFQEETIDKLLKAIVASDARTLYPLTQNFPKFRRTICNGIVTQTAFAASIVSAISIPVSDLLPITAIQTSMLLKIAQAFGYPLNRARARELIPMLGAGTLVREGSHQLRHRFPVQHKLIAVSVAGVWTFTLGKLAIRYFEKVSDFSHREETVELASPLVSKTT